MRTAHGEALARSQRTRVQFPAAPQNAFPQFSNELGFCFVCAGHGLVLSKGIVDHNAPNTPLELHVSYTIVTRAKSTRTKQTHMAKNKRNTRQRNTRRSFGNVQRLNSGRYRARYKHLEEWHNAPQTYATETDAQGWLFQEQRLLDLGVWTPPKIRQQQQREAEEREELTVGVWINRWLDRRKTRLKESTRQNYERVIKNRITDVKDAPAVAALANVQLHELNKATVYEWWDAMGVAFGTYTTNRKAYTYLRAALDDAVERELIPSNPVNIKEARKKPETKEKELPSTETLQSLIEHLPNQYKLLGVLCLFMGLRIGEALALKRKHLVNVGTDDSPQWVVQIRGNLQRIADDDGHVSMKWQTPKTKAGKRDVPIFAAFNDIVGMHVRDYAPQRATDYLTVTDGGNPVMDTSFRSVLERAREKAGIRQKITPHYGRNWLITCMCEEGATPAEIGSMLGQTDLKTITEIYMKVRPDNVAKVLGRVQNRIVDNGLGNVVPIGGRGKQSKNGA